LFVRKGFKFKCGICLLFWCFWLSKTWFTMELKLWAILHGMHDAIVFIYLHCGLIHILYQSHCDPTTMITKNEKCRMEQEDIREKKKK
jgi:hypothetical protein